MLVDFATMRSHACDSAGYKSGLSSERETPEIFSTAITRPDGTLSHCEIACTVMPSGVANPDKPPVELIALRKASVFCIVNNSSTALNLSQVPLHCACKGLLYAYRMMLGDRIRAARERLTPYRTQGFIAEKMGVSTQAVSQWERGEDTPGAERIPALRKLLRVTYHWLMEGEGPPPDPDSPEVRLEDLPEEHRAAEGAFLDSLDRRTSKSA